MNVRVGHKQKPYTYLYLLIAFTLIGLIYYDAIFLEKPLYLKGGGGGRGGGGSRGGRSSSSSTSHSTSTSHTSSSRSRTGSSGGRIIPSSSATIPTPAGASSKPVTHSEATSWVNSPTTSTTHSATYIGAGGSRTSTNSTSKNGRTGNTGIYNNPRTGTRGGNYGMSFIVKFILGIILFFLSFPLIWYNEKRAVVSFLLIDHGQQICVQKNSAYFDPETNNKLVCIQGELQVDYSLSDDDIGVTVERGLILERIVEIYDYIEEKQGDEYIYNKDWMPSVGTSNISHGNEAILMKRDTKCRYLFQNSLFYNKDLYLGDFRVENEALGYLFCDINISLDGQSDKIRLEEIKNKTKKDLVDIDGKFLKISSKENKNKIGDMRITYNALIAPQNITIIALQNNQRLETFDFDHKVNESRMIEMAGNPVHNNELAQPLLVSDATREKIRDKKHEEKKGVTATIKQIFKTEDKKIFWVFQGHHSLNECFDIRRKMENTQTWVIRLIGFLVMTLGVFFFFAPLLALLTWIPIIGTIATFIVLLFSILVGAVLSLFTICLAWLFYRPILSALLFGAGALLALLAHFLL